MVSAAGWVDHDTLMIASESALFRFDLNTGVRTDLVALEAGNPATRSNDGRADPQGGFWIGTMAKDEANGQGAGAIYRYYRGELRLLYPGITIPNAICFTPDGRHAHFTDTVTQQVMKVALDDHGWPVGAPQVWLDLRSEGLYPDGAVVDAAGTMWLAQWGACRVAAYDANGRFVTEVRFGAVQTSCPAFGGADLATLFCTSATKTLTAAQLATHPDSGAVFAATPGAKGQAEHRVIL
jgi:sugar lactone lactonase YvrE